jgi:hypothetical protein
MPHNITAEMSDILSVYPHFQNLAMPFQSIEYESWLRQVGQSLHAKGGVDLVRKVLIELRHAPEGYSDDFLSYLAMKWPAN